jgi:WD40 repeat protein
MQGTTALLGTEGGKVCMHSLVDGSCELVMDSAMEPVTALDVAWNVSAALSSPIAAAGHATGGISVWDLMGESDDLPICELKGHMAKVTGLAFYARGEALLSSGQDGVVAVWDMLGGTRRAVLVGHSAPVNGVQVEAGREELALTWSDDGTAIVWMLESATRSRVLSGHTSYIVSARFVPVEAEGGARVRPQVVTAAGDGSVSLWDAGSGELLQVLAGHSAAVRCVHVSASGLSLLTCSEDATARLWDLRSRVVEMPMPHRGGINVRPRMLLPHA